MCFWNTVGAFVRFFVSSGIIGEHRGVDTGKLIERTQCYASTMQSFNSYLLESRLTQFILYISVERSQKQPTSQMHVVVAIVLATSIVVLITVTAFLAFLHKKCHASRTSSSTVKMPTVTAARKISDAFLAGDVEAGVWCPAPGEEGDAWSTGSSSSTGQETGKTKVHQQSWV